MQIYNNAQRGAVMSRDATTIAATLNLYLFDPQTRCFAGRYRLQFPTQLS